MDSRERIAKAIELKQNGLNCAQAVICAYTDVTGLDYQTSYNISSGFGSGMGNMEGTCGAISGANMVIGMINKEKEASSRAMRTLMAKFAERNGATQCKLLKGIGTGCVLRPCNECVADAVEFVEDIRNV